ncbi:MAG TPA: hypothetical protein DEO70_11270 [Bacteroidales bacterium]|nr:hypothetical protein [Bacteroidales bacterium]
MDKCRRDGRGNYQTHHFKQLIRLLMTTPPISGNNEIKIGQIINWLTKAEVFLDAGEEMLQQVAEKSRVVDLPVGQTLFNKGDDASAMYIVARGNLSVHIDGYELSELIEGDIFGEYALVDDLPRSASVKANTAVTLVELPKKDFLEILQNDTRSCFAVMKMMIRRGRRMNELEERLASSFHKIQKQNGELVQLNNEKNMLIDLVAHDLRNPLTSSRCAIEMLRQEKEDFTSDQLDYIKLIDNALNRMKSIVNQILDTEVIESSRLRLTPEQVDFATVLKEVTDGFLPFAQQKNIAIISLAETTLALTDRNFLTQIFDNLISNAIKYSPVGSAIVISLSQNPGFIRFEVQDQGQGIEPDELPRLFNRYQRGHINPTGGESSIGLGLSIVKKLITTLNGEVFCESKVGEGSRFIVLFPA